MSRPLTAKEHFLVTLLLTGTSYADRLLPCLSEQQVTEMDDGGMGSVQFYPPGLKAERRFGDDVAEVWLKDEDGMPRAYASKFCTSFLVREGTFGSKT